MFRTRSTGYGSSDTAAARSSASAPTIAPR